MHVFKYQIREDKKETPGHQTKQEKRQTMHYLWQFKRKDLKLESRDRLCGFLSLLELSSQPNVENRKKEIEIRIDYVVSSPFLLFQH